MRVPLTPRTSIPGGIVRGSIMADEDPLGLTGKIMEETALAPARSLAMNARPRALPSMVEWQTDFRKELDDMERELKQRIANLRLRLG